MISRVESAQNWLESVTYQMNHMKYKDQAEYLAGYVFMTLVLPRKWFTRFNPAPSPFSRNTPLRLLKKLLVMLFKFVFQINNQPPMLIWCSRCSVGAESQRQVWKATFIVDLSAIYVFHWQGWADSLSITTVLFPSMRMLQRYLHYFSSTLNWHELSLSNSVLGGGKFILPSS